MIEKFGLQRHASLDGRKYHFNASNNFATGRNFCASRNFCTSRHFSASSKFCASRNFCASSKFCARRNFCASSKFFASRNFCASNKFCASRNFCASSKFCAGSNFCASRNICVLFVLLLYVPKSATLAMVRRSAHLITSFLGKLEEAANHLLYYVMGARVLDPGPSGRGFEPHRRHCIVPLSKKHLSYLSTRSTQEDPSLYN